MTDAATADPAGLLIGCAAIAARMGATTNLVAHLCRTNALPAHRVGKSFAIRAAALDDWLARHPAQDGRAEPASPDPVGDFVAGHVVRARHGCVQARTLYDAYLAFTATHGHAALSEVRFAREMTRRVGRSQMVSGRKTYTGVDLRDRCRSSSANQPI